MDELEDVRDKAKPQEIWLVVDSQVGQDAVTSAREFDRRLACTGIVLTKTDGDARGGAALSLREVTGKPVRFVGVGEKLDALEPFVPERIASRILGMGDVVSLVEKAQEVVDHAEARQTAERMFKDTWTLEDFKLQLGQIRAMSGKTGGLAGLMKHFPGMAEVPDEALGRLDESQLVHWQACIDSMTPRERMDPETIHGQRRARIARGAGLQVGAVNEVLKAFKQMRRQMKDLKSKGLLGRLAGRQMDKSKRRQIDELRRRGFDFRQFFPDEGPPPE
jgi:signal recognition particle subunit SRP54